MMIMYLLSIINKIIIIITENKNHDEDVSDATATTFLGDNRQLHATFITIVAVTTQ